MNHTVRKQKHRESKSVGKVIYFCVLIVLIGVFVGCAIYLIRYYGASKKSEDLVDDLKELTVEDLSNVADKDVVPVVNIPIVQTVTDAGEEQKFMVVDDEIVLIKYAKLFKKNHDFKGWLTIKDTEIDYPVMCTPWNEEYYLRRDFNGEYSEAGTLFIDTDSDYKKPSDNILIYGHNMNSGKMFHDLLKYENVSFYQDHKFITFDTIKREGTYEVIAAFRTKIYPDSDYTSFKYYTFFNATTSEEFDEYVRNCKELTPYETENTAVFGDELITLSTCAYHDENGRYVVVAKRVR